MTPVSDRVLVGIGDELRGDDGVGCCVVRRLRDLDLPGVDCLLLGADVTALIEVLGAARDVYLFDAMHSGAPVGTVRRVDALNEELPTELGLCSTHGLGFAEACRLADVFGKLPETLVAFCVEAETFTLGRGLSAPVRAAVERVVRDVTREVDPHSGC